jgi:hypothetical protein
MFTLATVIGLQFNHTILPKLLIYLVAPKANDGHASPFIHRNLRKKYAAQIAGNGVSGLRISKIFRGSMRPDPPSYAWFRSHGQFWGWIRPCQLLYTQGMDMRNSAI